MNSNECSFAHHRYDLPNATTNTKNVQHFLYMYPKSYIVVRVTEFQVFVPLIIKDRRCIRSIRYQVCAQISNFLCCYVANFPLSLFFYLSTFIPHCLIGRSNSFNILFRLLHRFVLCCSFSIHFNPILIFTKEFVLGAPIHTTTLQLQWHQVYVYSASFIWF